MTKIETNTRFLTVSDGKIYRVLNVMFDDDCKTDVVTFCGTLTYKERQSRGCTKLSELTSKIDLGRVKLVTTKLGELDSSKPDSNWRPEIVDTIL